MPTIQIVPPRDIEGSPNEVLQATLDQLDATLPAFQQLIEQSATQVRSAWLSSELNREPDLPPSELSVRWTESEIATDLNHMIAAAKLIRRNAQRARKAVGGRQQASESAP